MIPKFDVWCNDHNEWEQHKIFIDNDGLVWHDARCCLMLLKPSSHVIVWHTGAKDANGVNIREGDIIRKEECSPDDVAFGYYGSIGVVKYIVETMGFIIDSEDDGFYDNMGAKFSFDEIEVIGNVYENPELLEAGE